MICLRLLVLILLIYAHYQYNVVRCEESILVRYVCKVTERIVTENSDTNDVVIGKFNSKMTNEFFDEVVKCISRHTLVLTTDFSKKIDNAYLRKAQVIIFVSDEGNMNSLHSIIINHSLTPIFDHMSKFIFVYSQPPMQTDQQNTVNLFAHYGILKIVLIYQKNDRIDSLRRKQIDLHVYDTDIDDSKILFPDVLKNLKGSSYTILVHQQIPRVVIESTTVRSQMLLFLDAVAEKQNARISLRLVKDAVDVEKYYYDRNMHLTINTAAVIKSVDRNEDPKLLTYEETGYCALIPRPKSTSFELILLSPFEWKIWAAFWTSMLVAGIAWRLFKGRGAVNNVWRFFGGILAFFLGQSISFRTNHYILTTMLQIIIFATIILSCLYQGELSAIMIKPPEHPKLSTFDELFESDYKIMTSEYANSLMSNFDNYERIRSRIYVATEHLYKANFSDLANDNYALMMQCYQAEYNNEFFSNEFYYLLDHQILKYFVRLEASYNNPLYGRLQELMDWCFEAGLPQAWKFFNENINVFKTQPAGVEMFLKFHDFGQVFSILAIGLLAATLVFITELLYHNCGENLHM